MGYLRLNLVHTGLVYYQTTFPTQLVVLKGMNGEVCNQSPAPKNEQEEKEKKIYEIKEIQ